jgi:hypothetical protein
VANISRVTLKWHGAKVKGQVRTEYRKRISRCAGLVKTEAIGLVGMSGSVQRIRQSRRRVKGEVKVFRKRSKRIGAVVSAPGEPPRQQTGRLKRSIKVRVKGMKGRVFSRDQKAHLLEFGTRRMKARPWLNVALRARHPQIASILKARMKLGV